MFSVLWGVFVPGLSLVVLGLVCSMGIQSVDESFDSGVIMGVAAYVLEFSLVADLSVLRCLRFLRSDFPDGVCTAYDLGSTHLCVTTAGDHLLESGSYM